MFERYTVKARRVIFFARYEASQLGADAIEPHHILLGLLREDQQLFIRFCNLTPLAIENLQSRIRTETALSEKTPTSADMPLSNKAKNVLKYAMDESDQLSHQHIGTEHLLLGVLRDEHSTGVRALIEQGVDSTAIREQLRNVTHRPADYEAVVELQRLAAEILLLDPATLKEAEGIEAICDRLANLIRSVKGWR